METELSPRERHLLEAILHLLLYIGVESDDEVVKKAKDLVFLSGQNPRTDYSRPKIPMGG